MGEKELAHAMFDSSRVILEAALAERPNDFRVWLGLGLTYAGLGEKAKAITEGLRAVDMWPLSKDAAAGTTTLRTLTRILIMVGEHERAIDQIDRLLNMPSQLTIGFLSVAPEFDSLRDNPRFQALLKQEDE